MVKTLGTTWRTDLMRERIQAKLSSELSADLFPDRSPPDEPVAEVPPGRKLSPQKKHTDPPPNASNLESSSLDEPEAEVASAQTAVRKAPLLGGGGGQGMVNGTPPTGQPPPCPLPSQGGELLEVDPTLAALLSEGDESDAGPGSNNWVVSGAHTQSGKPLLASDPHLDHSVPSVWYMVHLKGPGLNVSGVSLPGLPFVVVGHNEKIAWGMTNTGPDVQDLYVESFDSTAPSKYLHNGAWVEAEVRAEVIKVRGKRDHRLTVKVTRHGPIISHEGNRDLALRWTALEPHALSALFNSVSAINLAQNWEQFTAALHDYTGPMQNFVYADLDGNIGYYAAAWVPCGNRAPAPCRCPAIRTTTTGSTTFCSSIFRIPTIPQVA
jgi:acyl-homoserine lactone acylase PvdQ